MSRTTSDRYQRQVLELVKQPGNSQCADCKAPTPRWASWDQGVFLCVKCASMHRKIGSHITKVKSLTLDTWTRDQVENMRNLGNVKVNSLLNPDERRNPPPPPDSDGDSRNSELERFVRNKYEYKVYQDFDHPAPTSPPLSLPLRTVPPRTHSGIASINNVPPPPIRSNSVVYSPPPGPPPPLASTPRAPPLPSRASTIPPTAVSHAPVSRPAKSVRFPSDPPVEIPSPPDSDADDYHDNDDDDGNSYAPRTRARSRHRTLGPSSTRSILVRRANASAIPIDWAALTRESDFGDDYQDDVPLHALGALGVKGANVGLVGVPTGGGPGVAGYTPMAMYGAGQGQGQSQGLGSAGGMQPLMPQFTGSAKGYLHQMHAGTFQGPPSTTNTNGVNFAQQPQMLVPQMTGSVSKSYGHGQGNGRVGMDGDSFMRMFQPPTTTTIGGPGGNVPQSNSMQHQTQLSQQQFQPAPPQPNRTNPFTQFIAPAQPSASSHLQAPSSSVWDDLVSLSPSPSSTPLPEPQVSPLRPQLTGFVPSSSFGQQLARDSSPSPAPPSQLFDSSAQRSTSPFQPHGSMRQDLSPSSQNPSPLKPQYTGFVPSSSYGQSLQTQRTGAEVQSATPQALQPQRTGFVPSSSFGQQLAKDLDRGGGGGATNPNSNRSDSPGLFNFEPNGAPRRASPGLFDFDALAGPSADSNSRPSGPQFAQLTGNGQQQQQQQRNPSPNPFMTLSNTLGPALPRPAPASQPQQPYSTGPVGNGLSSGSAPGAATTNPFFSFSGPTASSFPAQNNNNNNNNNSFVDGFEQQSHQQLQHQQTSSFFQPPPHNDLVGGGHGGLRPQLTGFAPIGAGGGGGGGSGTNPFLMMNHHHHQHDQQRQQQQQQQQYSGYR